VEKESELVEMEDRLKETTSYYKQFSISGNVSEFSKILKL